MVVTIHSVRMKWADFRTVLMMTIAALCPCKALIDVQSFGFCNYAELCYYHETSVNWTKLPSINLADTLPAVCPVYKECINNSNDSATIADESNRTNYSKAAEMCPLFSQCQAYGSIPDTLTWNLHAKWVCPNTLYCESNANKVTELRQNLFSCCTSCSCAFDCGMNNECCFTSDDNFNVVEAENMACFPIKTTEGELSFSMISTCPNGQACLKADDAILPVSANNRIYATSACAACNQVSDYHKWNIFAFCDAGRMDIHEIPWSIYQGDNRCDSAIVPPSTTDELWIKHFICNETETCDESFQNQDIIDACKASRAPFIFTDNSGNVTAFRNVHCAMCNLVMYSIAYINIFELQMAPICHLSKYPYDPYLSEYNVILDSDLMELYKRSSTGADVPDNKCKEDGIMIPREKGECIPVFCPFGMMLNGDGKCSYLILTIEETSFQVHFRLTPKETISTAYLKDIAAKQIDTWLHSKCSLMAQGGATAVLSSLIENGEKNVKELFVTITQYHDGLKLEKVVNDVRHCLEVKWEVDIGWVSFEFVAELARNTLTLPVFNNNNNRVPDKDIGTRNDENTKENKMTNTDVLYSDLDLIAGGYNHFIPLLVLTKLYFCDQVELKYEDLVIPNGVTTVVVVNEITVVYNNLTLGNNEFNIMPSYGADPFRVRVCLNDAMIQHRPNDMADLNHQHNATSEPNSSGDGINDPVNGTNVSANGIGNSAINVSGANVLANFSHTMFGFIILLHTVN